MLNKNIRSFPVLPHSNHYVWTRVGYFLLKFLCTKDKIEGNIISVQLILLSKGKKPSQNSRQRWGSTLSIHQSRGLHVNFHCVKNVQIRSFFWSVFSRIRTEYGEIQSISPYSVWMRENTDQKKHRIRTLSTQSLQLLVCMNWLNFDPGAKTWRYFRF